MKLFALVGVRLLGIGAGSALGLTTLQWLALAGGSLMATLVFRHQPSRRLFALLLVLFLGAARSSHSLRPPSPTDVRLFNDLEPRVEVIGLIVDYPDVRETHVGLRVRAREISVDGESRPARMSGRPPLTG